jgi:chromosome segregation ATPase
MQIRSVRSIALVIAVLVVLGVCFVTAGAQKRTRRSRRVKHPVATASPSPAADSAASSGEPQIISTADQSATSTTQKSATGAKRNVAPAPESEQDALRRTISDLSGQVTKLSDKLSKMEDQQRTLVDMERLTRAEQRAENLSTQLRDVQAKETELHDQLDQIEFALQPANIERVVGTFGTTHPEDAREQRRKQLEGQRTRIRTQLDQLAQSRTRLETAIASADAEVELLRKRMDEYNQEQNPAVVPGGTDAPPAKPPEE